MIGRGSQREGACSAFLVLEFREARLRVLELSSATIWQPLDWCYARKEKCVDEAAQPAAR